MLQATPNALDNPRDTFAQKSTEVEAESTPSVMPSDLAEIASLWADLPYHVRAGLVTMAKAAVKGKDV